MEKTNANGIIFVPYICKTIKSDVNGETVWHSNKFINFLLKVKRLFYKSKNLKNHEIYSKTQIDSRYLTITLTEIPLIGENIFIYGQNVKIVNIEKINNKTTLLHLEKPIVVPDSRYTTDIINLNEYIK